MEKQHYKKLHHYNTPGHAHELTFSCYHRYDYFSDPKACQIFLAVLNNAREIYQFRLWAYVLMPNHVHLLIWPLKYDYDIARIQSGIKGITAKRYRKYLMETNPDQERDFHVKKRGKSSFRFWQPGGGFDRNLWNAKVIHDSIRYIENNPVRKKLLAAPEEYRWSSAYARVNGTEPVLDICNLPVNMDNPKLNPSGRV